MKKVWKPIGGKIRKKIRSMLRLTQEQDASELEKQIKEEIELYELTPFLSHPWDKIKSAKNIIKYCLNYNGLTGKTYPLSEEISISLKTIIAQEGRFAPTEPVTRIELPQQPYPRNVHFSTERKYRAPWSLSRTLNFARRKYFQSNTVSEFPTESAHDYRS